MNREPYWEYMGRRSKEERSRQNFYMPSSMTKEKLMLIEIQQMQKQVYDLYERVIELRNEVDHLKLKVTILGGDPRQMELDV